MWPRYVAEYAIPIALIVSVFTTGVTPLSLPALQPLAPTNQTMIVSPLNLHDTSQGRGEALTTGATGTAANWTNLTPVKSPPGVEGPAMAYDYSDGYLVAYGGYLNQGGLSNQTWIFQDESWVNITSVVGANPGPLYYATMTYDPQLGALIMFGGETPQYSGSNNLWTFQNGHWSELNPECTPECPAPAQAAPMVYDSKDGYVVLADTSESGNSCTFTFVNDLWTGLPLESSSNSSRPCPPMTYDSGSFVEGVGAMGYDLTSQEVLYYVYNQTWLYSGGNWTEVTNQDGHAPGWMVNEMMSNDSQTGAILLYGGMCLHGFEECNSTFTYNDTWVYQGGVWTNDTNEGLSPEPLARAAMTYDPSESAVMLFGGSPEQGMFTNSTWAWSSDVGLSGLAISATPSTPLPGQSVAFTSDFSGGTPPITYEWNFGDGSVSALADPTHTFVHPGVFDVVLYVNDSASHTGMAHLKLNVYQPLSTPIVAATPDPAVLGQFVSFSVNESGGTPPYTYSWSFGDGGTGGNLSNITHVYTTNGPFVATVTVSDVTGKSAHGSVDISIALEVGLVATSSTLTAGQETTLTASIDGGDPPYVVSWPVLPAWCNLTQAESSLSDAADCTPPSAGTFTIQVNVHDSVGHVAMNSVTLHVSALGSSAYGKLPAEDFGLIIGGVVTFALAVLVVVVTALRAKRNPPAPPPADPYASFFRPESDLRKFEVKTLGENETDPASDLY